MYFLVFVAKKKLDIFIFIIIIEFVMSFIYQFCVLFFIELHLILLLFSVVY